MQFVKFGWTEPWGGSSAGSGAVTLPTASGREVLGVEVRRPQFEAACDWLDANKAGSDWTSAARDLCWTHALRGRTRLFFALSKVTSLDGTTGEAVSEIGGAPLTSINFDNMLAAIRLCGTAAGGVWDMMNSAQRTIMAVMTMAYWGARDGSEGYGNTNHGQSHNDAALEGIKVNAGTPGVDDGKGATLTGVKLDGAKVVQFAEWRAWGLISPADPLGNVWVWEAFVAFENYQLRVCDPASGDQPSHDPTSSAWRLVAADGSLLSLASGDPSIHLDTTSGIKWALAQAGTGANVPLNSVAVDAPAAGAIPILTALGLYSPYASEGRAYANIVSASRRLLRGGGWYNGSNAGVLAWNGNNGPSIADWNFGSRSAFVI